MHSYFIDSATKSVQKSSIGTKAYNLLQLEKNACNVPRFFCISPSFLQNYLTEHAAAINSIASSINYDNELSIRESAKRIQKLISAIQIDTDFQDSLHNYLKENFKSIKTVSVRSSASVEDMADASFAGQFSTYLHVPVQEIAERIITCWASLFAPNVLAYCKTKKIALHNLDMCVVIQEMIDSDVSGVIFSANPQGLLNEIVTVVGRGVGANVVDDKVATTSYYHNIHDEVYYYDQQQGAPLLDKELYSNLIQTIPVLQKLFGEYIDIEYAIKKETIYLLQVRSITTFDNCQLVILDNSNIVESYPGITLPLTESFITEAYYRVFRGVLLRGTHSKETVGMYNPLLREMVSSANGRMYYKISNWYALIQFLPFSKKIIPIWQEMIGVHNKQFAIPQKYQKKPNSMRDIAIYWNALYLTIRLPHKMDMLASDFIKTRAYFDLHYQPGISNQKLLQIFHHVTHLVLPNWDLTLSNDVYAFTYTGLLKNALKRLGVPRYQYITNSYVSGIANIESMKPVHALIDLCFIAQNDGMLAEIQKFSDDEAAKLYLDTHQDNDFGRACSAYIHEYGDRSVEELKLETATFRSSPLLLMQKITEYTADPNKLRSIKKSLDAKISRSEDQTLHISRLQKMLIHFYRNRALTGIKNREISRMNRSRIYGMVREIMNSLGDNLASIKKLTDKRDIYYLTLNEVEQCIRDDSFDPKPIIEQRKLSYEQYEKLPMYSRLVFANYVFNKTHRTINAYTIQRATGSLHGIPCSGGIVEGEVVVIDKPKDAENIKDKILVTKMTDPGWVFLLAVSKGIVTEKGSLLSHTAIISRELGIPSVVNVKHITRILRTGDKIRLDANNGTIEVLTK